MSDLIMNVNDAELTEILRQSEIPVLLDLWAPWCGPCQALAPLLEQVAENTVGKLAVLKLDIEQFPEVSARLRVRSIPTLLLIKSGEEVSRKIGVDSLSDINQWLRSQGIETESDDEVIISAGSEWLSFYQDQELFDFMTKRLSNKAAKGEVAQTYVFPRPAGQSTALYTLAGTESLEVFERVTGIPAVIGQWADFLDYATSGDCEALISSLAIGKDYSSVPLNLIAYWLNSSTINWQSMLSAPVNNLRQEWLLLVAPILTNGESPRNRWVELESEANRLLEAFAKEGSEFEKRLIHILASLSPPINATDTDTWNMVLYNLYECLSELLKVRAGWTLEERGYAEVRWQWLEPLIPEDTADDMFEQVVEQLRYDWQTQSEAYTLFAKKEEDFYSRFPSSFQEEIRPMKHQFLLLLEQTPVVE